jgi:hypothetical protein
MVLITEGVFVIQYMAVSFPQGPGDIFCRPLIKEKLLLYGPALPVKPYIAFMGNGRIETKAVKAALLRKRDQFVGIGGYIYNSVRL